MTDRAAASRVSRLQVVVMAVIAVVLLGLASILLVRPAFLDVSEALYRNKIRFRPDAPLVIINPQNDRR